MDASSRAARVTRRQVGGGGSLARYIAALVFVSAMMCLVRVGVASNRGELGRVPSIATRTPSPPVPTATRDPAVAPAGPGPGAGPAKGGELSAHEARPRAEGPGKAPLREPGTATGARDAPLVDRDWNTSFDRLLAEGTTASAGPPLAAQNHVPAIATEPICDPFTVPFIDAAACEALLANRGAWSRLEPMGPKFEQRTIKFRVTVPNGADPAVARARGLPATVQGILKVPQVMFPTEPFSETAAYTIERRLGVHRVPPTVLVAVPIDELLTVAETQGAAIPMVSEFNERGQTWPQWVKKDVADWLRNAKHERFTTEGGTKVWCSVQLAIDAVSPLLQSPLSLPYSKAKPGWHRWFNPRWSGFVKLRQRGPRVQGALLATSALAMMDFLLLNNDRSPNKNNFVVAGVRPPSSSQVKEGVSSGAAEADLKRYERVRRGLPPTFVHLDQGMALNGFPHPHNPVAKPHNNTFCWFYRPLLERVRTVLTEQGGGAEGVERWLLAAMPEAVTAAVGTKRVSLVARQFPRLVDKADACIADFHGDRDLVIPDATTADRGPSGEEEPAATGAARTPHHPHKKKDRHAHHGHERT